jgi:uncharacterized membrane protein
MDLLPWFHCFLLKTQDPKTQRRLQQRKLSLVFAKTSAWAEQLQLTLKHSFNQYFLQLRERKY